MSGLVTGRQGRVDTIPPVEGERDMQAGKTARDGTIYQARSRIPMNRLQAACMIGINIVLLLMC